MKLTAKQDGVTEAKFAKLKPLKSKKNGRNNCCKDIDYQAIPEKTKRALKIASLLPGRSFSSQGREGKQGRSWWYPRVWVKLGAMG